MSEKILWFVFVPPSGVLQVKQLVMSHLFLVPQQNSSTYTCIDIKGALSVSRCGYKLLTSS